MTPPAVTPGHDPADRLLRRLASKRVLARLVIFFEQFWLVVWPVLGVLGGFAVLALLDGFRSLPPWLHLLALIAIGGALGWTVWRAVRTLAWPDARAGDRRLERASNLAHRPLTTLTDRPATDRIAPTGLAGADAVAQALWQTHLARAMRQVGALRVGPPHPGLPSHDPRALRAGLIVALAAALGVAGTDAPGRLAIAFVPDFAASTHGPGLQVQAWITPPPYTRLAPSFLKPEGGAIAVPAGARLTLSVTGTAIAPTARFAGTAAAQPIDIRTLDPTSFQGEHELTETGKLVLHTGGRDLAAWDVTIIPDRPPSAAWTEPPGPNAPSGTAGPARPSQLTTRLPWQATDDYGVVGLHVEFRLRDRPAAPLLVVKLPLAGVPTNPRGLTQSNLVAHPWAGLAVTARLIARDAQDQTGASEAASFVLPERHFEHKIAKVLIGARKQLSLIPEDRAAALATLRGVLGAPESLAGDHGAWLNLSAIASLLVRQKKPEAVDEVQARLWDLALYLEEGGSERTARALEAARQATRDALEQLSRSPEEQAKRAELERKLAELQDAIRQHLDALREEARRENSEIPPNIERLDPREMERLTREAQQAAREGKPDDVRERLAELERMLEEMRNAQSNSPANEERNAERRQRGRQQMGVVQDMIAREAQVLDHAQTRAPPGTDLTRPRRTPPPKPNVPADAVAGDRQLDQRVQQALRRALGEVMQQFGDLTGKIPPALTEADLAMRDGAEALGQGQDASAARYAQRAIEALQRGGREMGRQMARQFGRSQPGESGEGQDGDPGGMGFSLQDGQSDQFGSGRQGQHGRRQNSDRRDPLGRQLGQGNAGIEDGLDVEVPDEMERQRTQTLQQELRRRGGERFRPQPELDYIDRLLRQF